MRLFFVRHGETPDNAAKRFMGYEPVSLSPRGVAQAERLAERLVDQAFDRILSSDVRRVVETAEILTRGRRAEGRAFDVTSELREVDVGRAVGLTYEEVGERWPEIYSPEGTGRFPGGESFADVADRVVRWLRTELSMNDRGHVLVVTHGGVVRGACARLLGRGLGELPSAIVDNASLTVLDVTGSAAALVSWNDTSHLASRA